MACYDNTPYESYLYVIITDAQKTGVMPDSSLTVTLQGLAEWLAHRKS
jgi:hypothetical protein